MNEQTRTAAALQSALIRKREVLQLSGLSNTSLYELIRDKAFPAQVKLVPGGRAVAWRMRDVMEWCEKRQSTGVAP